MLSCMAVTAESAAALSPPVVYMRPIGESSEALGSWQPLDAQVTHLGPYQIGVALQSTTAVYNRQAAQVELVSKPGGASTPSRWQDIGPYTPNCELLAGDPGTISETGDTVYFQGNGTYTLKVSAFTYAQYNARPGSTCSDGEASTVNLTVNAAGALRLVGTPLVPRTTIEPKGFNGLRFIAPQGAAGDQWRCARDPVRSPGGPVTGSLVTVSQADEETNLRDELDESLAFTAPGRWACSVQMFGGDLVGIVFGTPWTTTPTFTVRGQYMRDPRRTVLRRLPHHRLRLVVPATRQVATAAVGGRLTFSLYRAGCGRRGVVLHRVARKRAVVDRHGVARFTFAAPTLTGFYLGRPAFGGTSLLLSGRDVDMTMRLTFDPAHPRGAPIFGFVNPSIWVPC
jgi:hypothetical protein